MNSPDDQPPMPTVEDVVAAMEVLRAGRLAVETGTWTSDMQEARDRAWGIVNRARLAGVL